MTDVPRIAAGDLASTSDVSTTGSSPSAGSPPRPREVDAHRRSPTPSRCATESPLLVLCLVEARFPAGTHETYQVPLGLRPAEEGWSERVIGEADGWTVYDALADPGARPRAAAPHALQRATSRSSEDELRFRWAESAGAGRGGTVDVRPGRRRAVQLVDRVRRRADPEGVPARRAGREPRARAAALPVRARGFPHIAALAGWYEVEGRYIDATLGILQEFLAGARDGWELALDELAARSRAAARPPARARRGDRRAAHARSARTTATRTSRPTSRRRRRCRSSDRRRRRADRARLPRPAGDRGGRADRRSRPGRAREAAARCRTSAPAAA